MYTRRKSVKLPSNLVLRSKQKSYHRSYFGSELTLHSDRDREDVTSHLSECQSEADLRGYCTSICTEDELDDRSVVSDFHHQQQQKSRLRSSSGNLAARLGILPENRTILNFKEAGNVFNTSSGLQIKTYGLIDDLVKDRETSETNAQVSLTCFFEKNIHKIKPIKQVTFSQ